MDLDSAETWRWIWLVVVLFFVVAELATPFMFFMLSFAIGGAVAAVAAFLGAEILVQWLLFLGGSVVALAVLIPIGLRITRGHSDGRQEGATRWVGRQAVVLEPIPSGPHATGLVRLERAQWRAETPGEEAVPEGAVVEVIAVEGTRLVVRPSAVRPAEEAGP
jgi:membrane protein implicated in regulation of membrane protease activity